MRMMLWVSVSRPAFGYESLAQPFPAVASSGYVAGWEIRQCVRKAKWLPRDWRQRGFWGSSRSSRKMAMEDHKWSWLCIRVAHPPPHPANLRGQLATVANLWMASAGQSAVATAVPPLPQGPLSPPPMTYLPLRWAVTLLCEFTGPCPFDKQTDWGA